MGVILLSAAIADEAKVHVRAMTSAAVAVLTVLRSGCVAPLGFKIMAFPVILFGYKRPTVMLTEHGRF
ncbi:hypothetical protein AEAC466_16840 [Asticcacaulis sp. AC466]|nr:hypothetical protein AEAC466_16840 [Asticcacaulis sp. AC466]